MGKRFGLISYIILLLLLLMLTKTRSAWIACFAVFAVYAVIFEPRYLVYLIVMPFAALLIPGMRDRLLDLGTNNEYVQYATLNSFAWRRLIWETSLQWMRVEHYLLGYGLDSFRYYSPQFFPLAGKLNPGAHNVYVQWLFEAGVSGLLAFVWLFGRLIWWLKSMFPADKLGAFVVISLVVEYLIISFSDNLIYYLAFNWYFWFIAGAGCAVTLAASRGSISDGDVELVRRGVVTVEHRA
jgi:O-antigen ligase